MTDYVMRCAKCEKISIPIPLAGYDEKTRALMEYKLEELTKKVEKHNSVVERTFILEEKMKVANHRIEDLEKRE